VRTLLAAFTCMILATTCSESQIIAPPPPQPTGGSAALRALPNMITYPKATDDYETGDEGLWPGGKPTRCNDLAKEYVSGLRPVGFITHIQSDATASVGAVGPSAGSVRVFTGVRTPPPSTVVIVAEPYGGCFVVYSPMV
jgi:hypothetical protein